MSSIEKHKGVQELIPTINEILKAALEPSLSILDRVSVLERSLIKIYSLSFEITYQFDNRDYPEFDKPLYQNIRQSIQSNFPDFGFYKTVTDILDMNDLSCEIGDAMDDLTDITLDLLEVKWRIENNSMNNGLWYFQLIFRGHTQQHVLDLLNYIKAKTV